MKLLKNNFRSAAAQNLKDLRRISGTSKSKTQYHPLQPSQIRNSELNANAVYKVLRHDYVNPFMVGIGDDLVNLSSGVPVQPEFSDSLLSVLTEGEVR